jgi:hypothetical protein
MDDTTIPTASPIFLFKVHFVHTVFPFKKDILVSLILKDSFIRLL